MTTDPGIQKSVFSGVIWDSTRPGAKFVAEESRLKNSVRWLFCLLYVPGILFAAEENPLIEQEVFPLSNASFEGGLQDWGGQSADGYRTAQTVGSQPVRSVGTAYEGKKSLCMVFEKHLGWVQQTYLSRQLQLKKGTKYYLSIKIKTEGEAYGSIRVVSGASGEPESVRIESDSDWQEVGVTFTGNSQIYGIVDPQPDVSYCELRLRAFGKGKVYFDDLRVYELKSYSPCLRVKLLEPKTENYQVFLHARVAFPAIWFKQRYFTDGSASAGEYSPWIDLGGHKTIAANPAAMHPDLVPAGIHFEMLDGRKFKKIKARVEFAYGPDSDKVIRSFVEENEGNVVGVVFPRSNAGPDHFMTSFRPLFEEAQERNDHVRSLQLAPANLKKFHIAGQLGGRNSFFSDPRFVEMEVDTLKRIGFSAIVEMASPYREVAARVGILKTRQVHRDGVMYHMPRINKVELKKARQNKYYQETDDAGGRICALDWDDIRKGLSDAVGAWLIQLRNADPEQIPLIDFVDIGDEISGPVFAGEAYDEGYREYLKSQGIAPQDMGKTTWKEVTPGWWGGIADRGRPTDRSNVPACMRFYWSLRYWSWVSAKTYRIVTKSLEKRLPGIRTRINFGQTWYNAGSDVRGTDVWEFSRQKAVTALCNEDWLNTYGWRHSGIQLNAYLADLNRSCAAIHAADVQAYVMPEKDEIIQRKLASAVGKGVKQIELFSYGPAYASPDNWSQNLSQVEGVAKFVRKLGKAEEVLYPGKPRKAEVAIVWSGSNEIWRDSLATIYNRHYVYFGLLHQQIPIDFIDEIEIEAGGLKDYKVIYLTSQYLRQETQEALAAWVQEGGNLWTDVFSATADEYAQESDRLLPVVGVKNLKIRETDGPLVAEAVDYRPDYGLQNHQPLDFITFKDSGQRVGALGMKATFTVADPERTKIMATFADGSPAVIEHQYGKGRAYYVGTMAGWSYAGTVKRVWGKVYTGYQAANRRLITDFPAMVGVNTPLTCSVPMVEADLLESEHGVGVVLANYAGDPLGNIDLAIQMPGVVTSVESVTHGRLQFVKDSDEDVIHVSLPLEVVDMLIIQ